jgi:acetylornithine deacetylase
MNTHAGMNIHESIDLLRQLIRTPSFSGEEGAIAELVAGFLAGRGMEVRRKGHNVITTGRFFDPRKPTLLLNSHLDTVRPGSGYTRDPFLPEIEGDRLYGLGSTDAGASVVSLTAAFLHFYERQGLAYNLCLALTAEEERSGAGGIESILNDLPPIDFALIGEPTSLRMAVAEKGLLVVDCTSRGRAGHAARREGVNAIYPAVRDIEWFETYRFPKVSEWLGEVNMAVTMIHGGTQHNVVPAECTFTADIRITEQYTHEEVLETIRRHVKSEVVPRSMRLRSSSIPVEHPVVQAGKKLGLDLFGSPTMSDQALIPAPSLKIGPGDSARSHTADEYVLLSEIEAGIDTYIRLLESIA